MSHGLRLLALLALGAALLSACASGSGNSQSDCDKIAAEIRDAANKRGVSSVGICSSTNPAIQKDFASACAQLKACNGG